MRLQYSASCVAYGFVVAAVAHVETKVKGSFFSSLLSLLFFLYRRRHLFLEASWPKKLYSNMYSCACLFCVLCRMLAYISRFYLRDFMYRMYVGCACGCLCVHKRFFSRRRRRLSWPFWERPLDGGGALRFGKDSLYHTRLVIIISAPHWIGRPKKNNSGRGCCICRCSTEMGG